MKQIAKTDQVLSRLRASYGPDAKLDNLAVFETTVLTTLPLRKAYGIFKGARASLSLMSEVAASINAESIPLQIQHDTEALPQGRLFYAEALNDEAVGLFAIDQVQHPTVVADIDNGTIDQVSIGMVNKRLTCSGCGYDYMAPANEMALYTLTCDEGHVIGQDGIHVFIDGLAQLFETSLVGKGAAVGARIVGPSDARLQSNEQYRLAATANPALRVLQLSPTTKDHPTMTPDQMAAFTAATNAGATAAAQLGVMTTERDARVAELATRDATIVELTTARDTALAANADSIANKAANDAAVAALTVEATTILTAVGKLEGTTLPTDVTALLALITEHRAAFAAAIPVEGAAAAAAAATAKLTAPHTNGAFRAPKN